jgi:hypothetical protein
MEIQVFSVRKKLILLIILWHYKMGYLPWHILRTNVYDTRSNGWNVWVGGNRETPHPTPNWPMARPWIQWLQLLPLRMRVRTYVYMNIKCRIVHILCIYTYYVWSASWSSGQSFWLLIMRSPVRFRFCHGDFYLKGKIPIVTMVWVVS